MKNRKGFTFIEIMFVIVIICILTAVSLPTMKGTLVQLRIKGAARDVTSLMRYARNAAVLREQPCEVRFSPEKDTYELVLLDSAGDPVKDDHHRRRRNKNDEQASILGDDTGGLRTLPNTVHFAVIYTAAPLTDDKNLPCVVYYPDGSATPATIAIQDDRKNAISVEIFRTTGMARVQAGLPSLDKKEKRQLYYGPREKKQARAE